jgi:hypothetical protein
MTMSVELREVDLSTDQPDVAEPADEASDGRPDDAGFRVEYDPEGFHQFLLGGRAATEHVAPDQAPPVAMPLQVGDHLSEQQAAVLTFERNWWRQPGAKEQAIRDQFRVPAIRYYQLLNRLLDSKAATEFDPVLVARLRRLRESRPVPRRLTAGNTPGRPVHQREV